MHLLTNYSLVAGQKIDRINILEKYYPVPFNDPYITFHPISKPSKNYSYYKETLSILGPIFEKAGIKIIQIGNKDEPSFPYCCSTQGTTDYGQVAYLVKNAKLHLGADSFPQILAGHYNIPLVALISNNYSECVKSYFGDKTKQIFLEPEQRKQGLKPSFMLDEGPIKQIDSIKPEVIAKSVCQLLGLEFTYPFETIYIGCFYNFPKMIESAPDVAINTQNLNIDSIIVRMDYLFNEQVLVNQLMVSNVTIVTNKPINQEILLKNKDKIKQIIYFIEHDNSPEFAQFLQSQGINYVLMSNLSEEELKPYKLDYIDYNLIIRKDKVNPANLVQFANIDLNSLWYKTNKITLGRQKIYSSRINYLQDKHVDSFNPDFSQAINEPMFWNELDYFLVAKRND